METKQNVVAYIRVSTKEQGDSGLGLEAQELAIKSFASQNNLNVVSMFSEVSSGKLGLDYRQQLKSAIDTAKKLKCKVVVAKLDRLSRSAAFIMNLMADKVPFIVCNLGLDVDNFMLHIYAVIAEKERVDIGARTSAALQAKKIRDPNWKPGFARTELQKTSGMTGADKQKVCAAASIASRKATADIFAAKVYKMLSSFRSEGMTFADIAKEANSHGLATFNGGMWHGGTVYNVLKRMGSSKTPANQVFTQQ